VRVHDVVAVLGCKEVVMGVHILHPGQKKLRMSQKRPLAMFDDPNIDWLSVQKDIVIHILFKSYFIDTEFAGWAYGGKTDLDIWASQNIYANGGMNSVLHHGDNSVPFCASQWWVA
jgi:hypothetical protein